jgi:hypothetical protein
MIAKITKVYIRKYSDSGQITAYVEWVDNKGISGRTEGKVDGIHMQELFKRARRELVPIEKEVW